jgi:hypothetical protein
MYAAVMSLAKSTVSTGIAIVFVWPSLIRQANLHHRAGQAGNLP